MNKKTQNSKLRPDAGGTIIVALFFTTALALVLGGVLKLALHEFKMSERAFLMNATLNLAEAGGEEAIWSLNSKDWTGWEQTGIYASKTVSNFDLGGGKSGVVLVIIEDYQNTAPTVFLEGSASTPLGSAIFRQVKIDLSPRSLFANGLSAKDEIIFSGDTMSFDSYDSSQGPYDFFLNRSDQITIGSTTVSSTVNVSDADIYGFVATGGTTPEFGSDAKVYGVSTPPAVPIDPNRVTTDFTANLPDVTAPTLTAPFTSLPPEVGGKISIGDPTGLVTEEYHIDKIDLSDGQELEIEGPVVVVVDNDVTVSGTGLISIQANGNATFYLNKGLTMSGDGLVDNSSDPSRTVIYGLETNPNGQDFTLSGDATLHAAVYAPNAKLTISGDVNFYGSIVTNTAYISGVSNFHYDEQLNGFFGGSPDSYKMESWRELTTQAEKIDFETYVSSNQ